jgi:hypothetical protein
MVLALRLCEVTVQLSDRAAVMAAPLGWENLLQGHSHSRGQNSVHHMGCSVGFPGILEQVL